MWSIWMFLCGHFSKAMSGSNDLVFSPHSVPLVAGGIFRQHFLFPVRIHVLHTMPAEEKQQLKQQLGWTLGLVKVLTLLSAQTLQRNNLAINGMRMLLDHTSPH